ncbi:hypothetical protein [Thiobaca trueperi]|uniref:Uncharacterized protein n=1 Tax=Thiobaca trueperi TaxID=127458 RepID=A0A4R3NAP3_9GAMM|nr:hypothetical protein [Thiobaca trueperi]TCT24223.1 hypothetical protein EDC35_101544 [Thiobaca trueperi]
MDRCPNCAARTDGSPACRRCGMDLASLLRVERAAEGLLTQAVAHLATGNPEAACAALTQSLALHRTPNAERLLGFVRQFAGQDSHLTEPHSVDEEMARVENRQGCTGLAHPPLLRL